MGSTFSGTSTLPLCTKTLALGFATITRAGGTTTRPDLVVNSPAVPGTDPVGGRSGVEGVGELKAGAGCEGLGGKSGVVFALAGDPVRGGAEGLGGWGSVVDAGFVTLGIGFVTAVDQAGGTLVTGAGSSWPEVRIGNVVAAETFGRGLGVIFAEAGFSGRGGRLMRRVSRLGAFGSEPSGVAESAIFSFL